MAPRQCEVAAEFVELSTKHACGHFKRIMTLPLGLMRF